MRILHHLLGKPSDSSLLVFSVADTDYNPVNEPLAFASGSDNEATACASVTIVEDFAFENTEEFSVHLSLNEEGARNVNFITQWATIRITDDDGMLIMSAYIETTIVLCHLAKAIVVSNVMKTP